MTLAISLTLFFVAAAGFVALRWPFVGLLVYLWLDFMRPHDSFLELRAFRPMLVVGAATLVGTVWQYRSRLLESWRPFAPFLALSGVVLFTTVLSQDPLESLPTLVEVGKMLVLVWALSVLVSTDDRFDAALWVISLALLILAVGAIVQGVDRGLMREFNIDLVVEGPPGDHDGPFRDNNNLARVLALSVPLWWLLAYRVGAATSAARAVWLRIVAAAGLVVTVAGIEFTFSRGGFLALLAGVSVVSLSYPPLRRALLIPPLFVAVLLILSPRPYLERIATIGRPAQETSVQGRLQIWEQALTTARDRPIQGQGPGTFGVGEPRRSSHNIFVEVFTETGLLGLAAYGWVLVAALVGLHRLRRRRTETEAGATADIGREAALRSASVGLEAALLAYLTASLALSSPFHSPLFIIMGLGLALRRQT